MTVSNHKLSKPLLGVLVSVIALTAFVLGFVTQYFVSPFFQTTPSVSNEDQEISIGQIRDVEELSTQRVIPSLLDLEDPVQFRDHFDRTGTLLDLLVLADRDSLQEYFAESKNITAHHFRKEVQTSIIQRLSVIDPRTALSVVQEQFSGIEQQSFLTTIFAEWSVVNLQEAIAEATGLESEQKEIVIASMIRSRDDLTVEERRDIARQCNSDWVAINLLSDGSEESIFADPEQEWLTFIEDNRDHFSNLSGTQTQALGHILLAWIERDGLKMLDPALAILPPKVSLLETITFVTDQLMDSTPSLALHLSLEMVAKDDQNHGFRYLARSIAGRWAEFEPRRALEATVNVPGRALRGMLQRSVSHQWARLDPDALLGIVDSLPDEIQVLVRQYALIAIAASQPESVVSMLSDFSIRKDRDVVARAIAVNWAKTDVAKLFEWIDTDSNVSHIQDELYRTVFNQLARSNPVLGVQEALARPEANDGEGWESTVIIRLVILGEVDTAVKLLPQVRSGITRVMAYRKVIEHLIDEQYDTKLAVDLFLQLGQNEVTKVRYLASKLTKVAPQHLYEELDNIEPKRIRDFVAGALYSHNRHKGTFTAQELQVLEAIIQNEN
ncbi:MAG: hypothetical protein F4X56_00495 [Gammaproteobacteria bacterium]|nr:hypothetical protein [Gammaproteobacteria bacterium]